jgi:predicted regulator of Ras-like GTPase activity (Roadblock/LC7/MglB family)
MSAAILSMCDKYLEDLEKSPVKQLMIKTNDSIIVFSKIDTEKVIVVLANSGINLGMFMHQLELLAKKFN